MSEIDYRQTSACFERVDWMSLFAPQRVAYYQQLPPAQFVGTAKVVDFDDGWRIEGVVKANAGGPGYTVALQFPNRAAVSRGEKRFAIKCECAQPSCAHAFHFLQGIRRALQTQARAQETDATRIEGVFTTLADNIAKLKHAAPPPAAMTEPQHIHLQIAASPVAVDELPRLRVTPSLQPPAPWSDDPQQRNDPFRFVSAEELSRYALLRMYPAGTAYAHSGDYWIQARQQEELLLTMAKEGRVSLPGGKVLERAPDIEPGLAWSIDLSGDQQLALTGADGHALSNIVLGQGLLHLDVNAGRIARVNCSEGLYRQVRAAPRVNPQDSKNVARALKQSAYADMPPPEDATNIKQQRKPPVARLRTRMTKAVGADGTSRVEIPAAHVVYAYGDVELSPGDFGSEGEVIRKTGKGLRRIRRNLKAEAEAEERLRQSGLVKQPDATFVIAGKRQADKAVFVNGLAAAQRAGLEVANPDQITFVDVDQPIDEMATVEDDGTSRFFSVGLRVQINGKPQELAGIIAGVLSDPNFSMTPGPEEPEGLYWAISLDDGQVIRLPLAQIRQIVAPLAEWLEGGAVKDGKIRLSRLQAAAIADEIGLARLGLLPDLRTAIDRLRTVLTEQVPPTPQHFIGTLRPYQREGVAWLNALAEGGLGGGLTDDMGLGKTVQVLAHLQYLKNRGQIGPDAGGPVLILVTPTAIGGWIKEVEKFTPGLRTLNLTGAERAERFAQISRTDIAFTTFALIWRDIEALREHPFSLVVVDEAHRIRNPLTQQATTVRQLRAPRFIAMTGTPIQNHLGDLWSSVDLVLPGLLGDRKHFDRAYRNPIEKYVDTERLAKLQRRIAPFMLRRTKEQVAKDLPPKTEVIKTITLGDKQRKLYETIRAAQADRVKQLLAEQGLNRSHVDVLDALMKMRQACCDPRLVKLDSARAVKESAKVDALMELLRELLAEGRRVLVFSQFVEMLKIIQEALDAERIDYLLLTGQTPMDKRQDLVDKFQEGRTPIFLISLMAGGEALTLTAADSVAIFDPWWNPKAEDQAADRAHRIGQTKPVFVYKFICEDTVEVVIRQMNERKAALADSVMEGGTTTSPQFDEEDLRELFGEDVVPKAKRA